VRGTTIAGLAASHLALFGVGYAVADKEPIDTEVTHTGFFQVDTSRVLATTVESLRDENKLLVLSAKIGAQVVMDRSRFYLFGLHQRLTVPAAVNYYLDLSQLTLADVTYDERAKLVRVKLPKLSMGDIAFQPENASTINGGLLSFSDEQVEEVRKLNYAQARRAVVAQAQQPSFVNAAKRQAITDVEQYFSIPLRIAGQPDVKVVATF
jgi:hypothetical protein